MMSSKVHIWLLLLCLGIITHARASRPNSEWFPRNPVSESITPRAAAATSSFSSSLFENDVSKTIRSAVLETEFFQGMVKNTLPPDHYGGYMVEDAAYCFEAVNSFDTAASEVQGDDPHFALYYRQQSAGYKKFIAFYYTKTWKLKSADSVVLSPAAATYISFESNLASSDAKYLSIGILAGRMLWPWIASQINDDVPANGLYRFWVDDFLPRSDAPSVPEQFVDQHSAEFDEAKSQAIFNEALVNELNFFLSACGEDLVTYDQFMSEDSSR